MSSTSASEQYVFDASSLIELERSNNLRILDGLGSRARVPQRVAREVNKEGTPLRRWLIRNPRNITKFAIPREGELYLKLMGSKSIDDGEAAAIAIAANRGWTLVTDDRPAKKAAIGLGVVCLSTKAFLERPLL